VLVIKYRHQNFSGHHLNNFLLIGLFFRIKKELEVTAAEKVGPANNYQFQTK
jgi:hypothetical protein